MKNFFIILGAAFVFLIAPLTLAQSGPSIASTDKTSAIGALTDEYMKFGLEESDAKSRAENAATSLVNGMKNDQYDVSASFDSIETQVHGLPTQGERREAASDALEAASGDVEDFTDLNPESHISVYPVIAGSPPYVTADEAFQSAQDQANEAISEIRRVLINPSRPGSVPTGDIVSDFIPQIIRQLYRFAWVGIFIALTVSGVLFVTAQDNDERLTKAKGMLYFTLIGFAFVAFSFAIVKAVTDIDFFRFI